MKIRLALIVAVIGILLSFSSLWANEKWPGVDEAVIEKYAKKFGVEPKEPIINTDQGDLLLFIFTAAGTVGGFVIGYNYRKIFKEKRV